MLAVKRKQMFEPPHKVGHLRETLLINYIFSLFDLGFLCAFPLPESVAPKSQTKHGNVSMCKVEGYLCIEGATSGQIMPGCMVIQGSDTSD